MRPQIENIKCNIRDSVRPFDGDGYAFKTALKELKADGMHFKYIAEKCHYIREAA
jgi:hypothetical protein